jgi:hypothetical protein
MELYVFYFEFLGEVLQIFHILFMLPILLLLFSHFFDRQFPQYIFTEVLVTECLLYFF